MKCMRRFTTRTSVAGFLHSQLHRQYAAVAAPAVLDIFAKTTLAQNRAKAAAFAPLLARCKRTVRHFRQRGLIRAFDVATTRSDFALAFSAPCWSKDCCA